MYMEIDQNCQFSQVMKFTSYPVLSSSIGMTITNFINWEAETRKCRPADCENGDIFTYTVLKMILY